MDEKSSKMPACSAGNALTQFNNQDVKDPSHAVEFTGPETIDLSEVEIIGFKSGENNNKLANSRLMQGESNSSTALETVGSSSCPVECKLEGTISISWRVILE